MAKKKSGRKTGSKTKGYFYRAGRGWYASTPGKGMERLRDEQGRPLKDKNLSQSVVRAAHARWLVAQQDKQHQAVKNDSTSQVTVLEACQAYLAYAQANGSAKTHHDRADTLFDFCFGLPPEFRPKDGKTPKRPSAKQKAEMNAKRIHPGHGQKLTGDLIPLHIDQWLAAHPNWDGGRRTRVQAVKRALNYAKHSGLIPSNPIRGYKVPQSNARVTYITPEQEEACYKHANFALARAIKVLIRTGARPGIEFAELTKAQIVDEGNRMKWHPRSKVPGKKRVILITDPEIIEIVRYQMRHYGRGPIFRNTKGNPWEAKILSHGFRRLKKRLKKKGISLDNDACLYSCRHTYAKRTLEGYWTGKATNIETLARLMGNSPDICRRHYLQWSEIDNEFLWDAA